MGNKLVKFESQINLVEATQTEYDFLRLVDQNPALYSLQILRNGLYRYESYWLPLCKEHAKERLLAPLDIEWIWHCHILNPFAYAKDCQEIVGIVVDHIPYKPSNDLLARSKSYWNKQFPNVPFDIDLKVLNPPLIQLDYVSKCSYDIVSAAQRQRVFNYSSSLPHYRDPLFLRNAVRRYKIMLKIKRDNPSTFIVPCYDNDLVWHTHQQHVSIYKTDTSNILGKMLDHDDSTSDRSPGSHLEQSSDTTRKLWRKNGFKFGVPGAMYRGEPPLPLVEVIGNRFFGLLEKGDYTFYTNQIVRTMQQADHIKDVLHIFL